jgi:DNA repair exonuclease SbcCD ATPase subunit
MKKIKYKNIKIQNFLSVGNDVIHIDFQKGLNQIDGINSDIPDRKNGVGKTVIANAHFFALFGETINKIKSEFIRNNITNKDGLITLDFDIETNQGTNSYTIKRYVKKASKVELFQGDTDITKSSIKETDKYICDLLSTNASIHRCCDIMTVRDTIPFMEMEAKDKRAFIESIFDIDVFGIMLKDLKKMITDAKKDKDVSSAKYSEMVRNYESLEKQRDVIIKENQEREEVLKKRKDDLNLKIEDLKLKIDDIHIPDIDPINRNIQKLNEAWSDLDGRISSCVIRSTHASVIIKDKQDKIKKCEHVDSGIECPECLQNIGVDHVEKLSKLSEAYQKELDDAKIELDSANAEKVNLNDKKNKIREKLEELQDQVKQIVSDNQRKESYQNTLSDYFVAMDEIDDDMLKKSASIDIVEADLESEGKRKTEESEILEELQQKLADYDICKFILGEEGVKSFVVKKLLDLLNNTIEKYLVELGLNVRVKFDEYFEEVITSEGKIFSYKNASGAEKKSLDFACAFSFADMRRKINQVTSNVEWMDECLDSAVDSVGLDLIIKVIKERIEKNDTCVYLISHRKEVKDKIDGELIMLEKSSKITRRIG